METYLDMPGGDNFEDATALFAQASSDMNAADMLMMDGFTLMDAMSAFEIGEPRMDSGMLDEEDSRNNFNPLAPLLPQELCWILDRSFACEMEWHAGNTLSQTVYTFLYVHQLTNINPDFLPSTSANADPDRPLELITVVLRAAVFGLLKSCDMAWRELAKNHVHDMEDWQGEKCDISLLEGVPPGHMIHKLDEACLWLRHAPLPLAPKEALINRLLLRKTLLELLQLDHSRHLDELQPLVTIAKNILRKIRDQPSHSPKPGSAALLAFDPRITRRLHNFVPIRVIELPAQDEVWNTVEQWLQDWEKLGRLLYTDSLSAWNISAYLDTWASRKPALAFIRSLTQTTFNDKNATFSEFPSWIVDRFFLETLGVPYISLRKILSGSWVGAEKPPLRDIEKLVSKLVLGHVKSLSYNPPRRRRFLMHSMTSWHSLHSILLDLTSHVVITNPTTMGLVTALPKVALLWKMAVAREIVLSGFQLDLYGPEERPVAYWFVTQVLEHHLVCINNLAHVVDQDSPAYLELEFQREFSGALQLISTALCILTTAQISLTEYRMRVNFGRRYKWLFPNLSNELAQPMFSLPPFNQFLQDIALILEDSLVTPRNCLNTAQNALVQVQNVNCRAMWDPDSSRDRMEFVHSTTNVTRALLDALTSVDGELERTTSLHMSWSPAYHPWFPKVGNQH